MQEEWWYSAQGRRTSTSYQELRDRIASGVLPLSTLVWRKGQEQWLEATNFPELCADLPPQLPGVLSDSKRLDAPESDPGQSGSAVVPPQSLNEAASEETRASEAVQDMQIVAGPWRRFLARTVDQMLFALCVFVAAIFFLHRGEGTAAASAPSWLPGLLVVLYLPCAMLLEAFIFSVLGTTPGKWLFSLRLFQLNGTPLTGQHYLSRQAGVYLYGLALGVPIVDWFTRYRQYARLSSGGSARYDDGRYQVHANPFSLARVAIACAIGITFVLGERLMDTASFRAVTRTTAVNAPPRASSPPQEFGNLSRRAEGVDPGNPDPPLVQTERQLEYLKWLGSASVRLTPFIPDWEPRKEFLQTLWYEAARQGVKRHVVLALCEEISQFRKFKMQPRPADPNTSAVGYLGVSTEWQRKIGDGDSGKLFHMQTNLRVSTALLRHFTENSGGDVSAGVAKYVASNGGIDLGTAVEVAERVMRRADFWQVQGID